MLQNDNTEDNYVLINPFDHQVGGHKVVLQISKRFICKPREDSEVNFYRGLPDCLRGCVPSYRGEIEVEYTEGKTGLELRAKVTSELKEEIDHCNNQQKIQLLQEHNSVTSNGKVKLSDWSEKCLKRTMQQYELWKENPKQQFVVLENLLADFSHPCIMDIKLGRKQGAIEHCSPEKRLLLEGRCAKSTSASLGFRLCGMQLYKKTTDEYISQNKYAHRNLDKDGAVAHLREFFHDGYVHRQTEIQNTLNRLQNLRSSISKQNVYNFLSVSLLIIYDSTCTDLVDVRLIDFANTKYRNGVTLTDSQDCNEDILFGLSSLINILQDNLLT